MWIKPKDVIYKHLLTLQPYMDQQDLTRVDEVVAALPPRTKELAKEFPFGVIWKVDDGLYAVVGWTAWGEVLVSPVQFAGKGGGIDLLKTMMLEPLRIAKQDLRVH